MMLLATLLYNMFDYCIIEQPLKNGPWLSHSETQSALSHSETHSALSHSETHSALSHSETHSALSHSETHSDNESMSGLEIFGTHITVAHALDMQTAYVQS